LWGGLTLRESRPDTELEMIQTNIGADRSVKTPLEFEATIRGMLEMMTDQKPE
jgi:hypothetical protein